MTNEQPEAIRLGNFWEDHAKNLQISILTADVKRFREAASCERDVRLELEKQVGTLQAEVRRLHEENAFLLDRLKDARELVADWGAYTFDYFQTKYGLKTDLAMLDAAIQRVEGMK